jgi:hypothetical protein
MKGLTVVMAALACCVLAGCQARMTLEEARAQCTKQGGFLIVIHSQKITRSGVGDEILSPGDCVSASKFDVPSPGNQPAPAAEVRP